MPAIKEIEEYHQFTTPAELHKAINTLKGMVAGITSGGITQDEIQELTYWCELHSHLRNRHPFSEILPVVEAAIADGKIDESEQADILWLCSNFVDDAKYYDIVTASIQFLHGLIHGIMADKELSDEEINNLKLWLTSNEFLRGTYPFDEIDSLIHTALEDKVVSHDEREMLMAFLSNVIEFKDSRNLCEADFEALRQKYSISGICSFCPEIEFKGKLFCFTGQSYRGTRAELVQEIEALGGIFRSAVSAKTDYLVVGNAGNPCWAYSCYGRKIEEAMALRKDGAKVQIINETDFWDAVWDAQVEQKHN